MKKLILILMIAVGFTACKKDEFSMRPLGSGTTTGSVTTPPDSPDKDQSSWRIITLVKGGNNIASQFTGYSIQFRPNGILTATKKGMITEGHWSTRREGDQQKLNIIFDSGALMALNNNWDVRERHVSVIHLEYVSGKDMADYLDLQKIN